MKKHTFLLIAILFASNIFAQELPKSYRHWGGAVEIVDWEYEISNELRKDALKRTNYPKSMKLYAYLDNAGFLSIGDHDRVSVAIYDKNLNWRETQLYMYEDNRGKLKKEYKKVSSKVKEIVEKNGFPAEEYFSFTKIINEKGYWYEVPVWKDDKKSVVVISADLELVRIDPPTVLDRTLFQSYSTWRGAETVDREYEITDELKADVYKRTHYKPSWNLYTFLDSDGNISVGDHDRVSIVVYDKDKNWLETQIWFDDNYYEVNDEQKLKDEYNFAKPEIEKNISENKFDLPNELYFTKVINPVGYWYEISAFKKDKWYNLIISKDFQLVRIDEIK